LIYYFVERQERKWKREREDNPRRRRTRGIYAEVEIPMASNLRPLSDKTLVTSNL